MSTAHSELPVIGCATAPARTDFYYWRLLATGLSFIAFGVGALLVGATLPWVRLGSTSRASKRRRARAVIGSSLRAFVGFMRGAGVLTYDFRGLEKLGQPGQLVIANHPSLIDVVFLLAFTRGAGCIVKHGLWRNPLTRGAVTLAEYVSNADAATMIEGAAAALQGGETLILFPEGTRSTPGARLAFQRGAANIALRAARVLTPVYIRVTPSTLTKGESWRRIPFRRPHFSLTVGEAIDLTTYRGQPLPTASRELNASLQALFAGELAGGSHS